MTPPSHRITSAHPEDVPVVQNLAQIIWRAVYAPILSPGQIDYMLDLMYSTAALEAEIASGEIRYDLLLEGERAIGFLAYGPSGEPGEMKLHKLYLLPDRHGRGLGSAMLKHAVNESTACGNWLLTLRVNKRNTAAIAVYRRHGFGVRESIAEDIGGGFVMDDYVMVKDLPRDLPRGDARLDSRA